MARIKPEVIELRNTAREDYQTCPMKYYLAWVKCVQLPQKGAALSWGAAMHSGLEAIYREIKEAQSNDIFSTISVRDRLSEANIRARDLWRSKEKERLEEYKLGNAFYTDDELQATLIEVEKTTDEVYQVLQNYIDYYIYDAEDWKILEIETTQTMWLPGDGGGRTLCRFGGTLDLVVEDPQKNQWIVEHKSTSLALDEFELTTYERPQHIGYISLAEKMKFRPRGIIYNVIRKKLPTIPHALKCKKKDCLVLGAACACNGTGVGALSVDKSIDTTPDVFTAELRKYPHLKYEDYAEFIGELQRRQKPFFMRCKAFVTPAMRDQWLRDTRAIYALMRMHRRGELPYMMNFSACNAIGRRCPYLTECSALRYEMTERGITRAPDIMQGVDFTGGKNG